MLVDKFPVRFIGIFLVLSLIVPAPSFALRPGAGLDAPDGAIRVGLEEKLRTDLKPSAATLAPSAPTAGLEEGTPLTLEQTAKNIREMQGVRYVMFGSGTDFWFELVSSPGKIEEKLRQFAEGEANPQFVVVQGSFRDTRRVELATGLEEIAVEVESSRTITYPVVPGAQFEFHPNDHTQEVVFKADDAGTQILAQRLGFPTGRALTAYRWFSLPATGTAPLVAMTDGESIVLLEPEGNGAVYTANTLKSDADRADLASVFQRYLPEHLRQLPIRWARENGISVVIQTPLEVAPGTKLQAVIGPWQRSAGPEEPEQTVEVEGALQWIATLAARHPFAYIGFIIPKEGSEPDRTGQTADWYAVHNRELAKEDLLQLAASHPKNQVRILKEDEQHYVFYSATGPSLWASRRLHGSERSWRIPKEGTVVGWSNRPDAPRGVKIASQSSNRWYLSVYPSTGLRSGEIFLYEEGNPRKVIRSWAFSISQLEKGFVFNWADIRMRLKTDPYRMDALLIQPVGKAPLLISDDTEEIPPAAGAEEAVQQLLRYKLTAVIPVPSVDRAVSVGRIVWKWGIIPEITFRGKREDALKAIEILASEGISVLAGTVLTPEDARDAANRGAKIIISPAFFPEVVAATLQAGAVPMPTVRDPQEALLAVRAGADKLLKVFPILGGKDFKEQVKGPLPEDLKKLFDQKIELVPSSDSRWPSLPQATFTQIYLHLKERGQGRKAFAIPDLQLWPLLDQIAAAVPGVGLVPTGHGGIQYITQLLGPGHTVVATGMLVSGTDAEAEATASQMAAALKSITTAGVEEAEQKLLMKIAGIARDIEWPQYEVLSVSDLAVEFQLSPSVVVRLLTQNKVEVKDDLVTVTEKTLPGFQAGLEEQTGIAAVPTVPTGGMQHYEGLFLDGKPDRLETNPDVVVHLNTEEGRKETYVIELAGSSDVVESAPLSSDIFILHQEGAEIPTALKGIPAVEFAGLEEVKAILEQRAREGKKGGIALVAPTTTDEDALDKLFRASEVTGIRMTPNTVAILDKLNQTAVFLISLIQRQRMGGLILETGLEEHNGQRRLFLDA